jgi:CubicO group peptidase (beta-lactamase class C family)
MTFILTMTKFNNANSGEKYFKEISAILSKKLGKEIEVLFSEQLSEKERRNLILRIEFKAKSDAQSQTLIFKQSLPEIGSDDQEEFNRFCRDWAGLEFMSKEDSVKSISPKFYGGSIPNRFVLLEDLGTKHISLVDSLTANNKNDAEAALNRFVNSLAGFHASSIGKDKAYLEIIKKLDTNKKTCEEELEEKKNIIHQVLKEILGKLNLKLTENLKKELDLILNNNFEPSPLTALTHGDICPDNVFDNSKNDTFHLIDFEYSAIGNALLDLTYLRMSMPTCWCAKTIPETLVNALEANYRQELEKHLLYKIDPDVYDHLYISACGYWAIYTIMNIAGALEADYNADSGPIPEGSRWNKDANLARPRILTRLKAFIDVSRRMNKFPEFRSTAEVVLEKITQYWPQTTSLDLYPAFCPVFCDMKILKNKIDLFKKNHPFNGSLSIANSGQIFYSSSSENFDTNTQYAVGSLTKQFTASAVLRAILDYKCAGSLACLADFIHKPLIFFLEKNHPIWKGSQVPEWVNKVTVHHLLSQTSGIPDVSMGEYSKFNEKAHSRSEVVSLYCKEKQLNFNPGEKYEYSAANYFLAGIIVESLSKKTLGQYLKDTFFIPLEMNNTHLPDHGTISDLQKQPEYANLAVGYIYSFKDNSKPKQYKKYFKSENNQGEGGLISTTNDLIKWNQAFYETETIIPKEIRTLILTKGKFSDYGYGLNIEQYNDQTVYTHDGYVPGYQSTMTYIPNSKTTIVHLSNISQEPIQFVDFIQKFQFLNKFNESERLEQEKLIYKEYPEGEKQLEKNRLIKITDF